MPETHHRSGSRTIAALLTLLALLASLVVTAAPAGARPVKTARARYPAAIEPLAAYQAQTTCSPRAKRGTANFAARLLAAYPTTRSLGIVRACSVGGRSEHKEGRAFDWGVNAKNPTDRLRAKRFLHWLLKTDRHGNRYAMARRLGIQYVIWKRRIWGSYAASAGWRRYTGPNPHTDHVHISFTWAGARGRTSFWTGKVGNVGAAPRPDLPQTVPNPPAPDLPGSTPVGIPARPEPVPAAALPAGPPLADETLTVPGTGDPAWTLGALTAGQEYLVEVSGTYQWGSRSSQVADAECSRAPGDSWWRRDRDVHPSSGGDHLDLYVDGVDLLADPDVDTGDDCDTRTHTYRWTYVPQRTGRVPFAVWDPTPGTDNGGGLTVRVIASVPRDEMTWRLPALAAAGVTSPGAVQAGETYLVTVAGTVDVGGGVVADAECSVAATDPTWRRDRSVLPDQPDADHHDLLLDRADRTFVPVVDPDDDGCDTDTHTYRYTLTPSRTAPVNLRVDDPVPGDGAGELTVTVTRVPPVVGPETVVLDTAAPAVSSVRNYLAGRPLLVTATGAWTYAAGVTADAECTATDTDPVWRSTRSTMVADGRYLGDVTLDGTLPDWRTATGSRCDPTGHAYSVTYTPRSTGPLRLGVADLDLADNAGAVTLTISPAG